MEHKLALGIGAGLTATGIIGYCVWRSREAKAATVRSRLNEASTPPIYYASLRQGSFDEDIGGGWVLLDVTDIRDPNLNTDRDVHVGNIVSLFLQHGGSSSKTPVKVFNVRVLGITGDDFTGQWIVEGPAGGPQMIDFRGAHIFSFH
jgi:hypothetical protein